MSTVLSASLSAERGSPRLDQAAVELVRTWRYVPGTLNGVPVTARFPVNIDWRLLVLPYVLPPDKARELDLEAYSPVSADYRFVLAEDGTIVNALIEKSGICTRMGSCRARFSPAS